MTLRVDRPTFRKFMDLATKNYKNEENEEIPQTQGECDEQTLSRSEMAKLMSGGTHEQDIDMDEIADEGARIPENLEIVPRAEWGAQEPLGVEKMLELSTAVMFSYSTRSKPCFDKDVCSKRSRNLQKRFMNMGFPDIPYNFMIGGDGRVYEGRGFNLLPETHEKYVQLKGFLIEIAFIGDYVFKRPEECMFDAALDLIQYGRVHFHVSDKFRLIENYE